MCAEEWDQQWAANRQAAVEPQTAPVRQTAYRHWVADQQSAYRELAAGQQVAYQELAAQAAYHRWVKERQIAAYQQTLNQQAANQQPANLQTQDLQAAILQANLQAYRQSSDQQQWAAAPQVADQQLVAYHKWVAARQAAINCRSASNCRSDVNL